jgi:hypothetical protein
MMHKAVVSDTYDASVIPWKGPESGPVVVNASFILQNIVSLDEKEEILTSKMFLNLAWSDPRLRWNPREYKGVEYVRHPSSMLWKPDIVLENSAMSSLYLSDLDPHSVLRVSHDGVVDWAPYVFSKTFSSVDATFLPFDDQTCHFKLSSWYYHSGLLHIQPVSYAINITGKYSSQWEVKEITSSVGLTADTGEEEGGLYFHCRYSVLMARQMNFSNLVLLVPCVILTMLTLMMFILPADQRMDLGLAIWTSLVLFLLIVNEAIPGSSAGHLPILGTYLILMLLLVSLSLVLVIINTAWQGKQLTDLPSWLQFTLHCSERISLSNHGTTEVSSTKDSTSKHLDKLSISVQIVAFLVVALFAGIYYA